MSDLAIVGMSCRLPGANNIVEFWNNLERGVESIQKLTDNDLIQNGVLPDIFNQPNYVKAAGIVEGVDQFDAAFFNMTPREAELMDPQHRLMLQCNWQALEHANQLKDIDTKRVSVYASQGFSHYLFNDLLSNNEFEPENYQQILLGNSYDCLATMLSYKLGLTGPSMTIQCGCSSSLVAIHQARVSLLTRQCDVAVIGASSLVLPTHSGYLHTNGGFVSSDGHCRAFSSDADGTIFTSGVASVVLKRLDSAIEDKDIIYCVLKGSAVNNDGSQKAGFTAPSVRGQQLAIEKAIRVAKVKASDIGYVETHGTGTQLGDPIEIEALTRAFHPVESKQYCAIGSVKTNIGHTDVCAGLIGLIKTALSLYHRKLPASLNYDKPNPKIDFDNSPFYVNTETKEWVPRGDIRYAGVSAFGFGGTNAHVILQEGDYRDNKPLVQSSTHIFQNKRYWIKKRAISQDEKQRLINPSDWLMVQNWRQIPSIENTAIDAEHWLVFNSTHPKFTALCEYLESNNHQLTYVDFPSDGDLSTMLDTIKSINGSFDNVLFGSVFSKCNNAMLSGFKSLLMFVQQYKSINNITIVTHEQINILGYESVDPAVTPIFTLMRVISQEYPQIKTKLVDVDSQIEVNTFANACRDNNTNDIVVYRQKSRWVPRYEKIDDIGDTSMFVKRGRYVITGGMGNVGLVHAEFLAKHYDADLVLIGRREYPPESEWNNIIELNDDKTLCKKLKKLHRIKNYGVNVNYEIADATNVDQMESVIKKYDRVDGIVHVAGVKNTKHYCKLEDLDFEYCNEVFEPKIKGLEVIDEITKRHKINMVLVISSLSSILAGMGLCAYGASHQYIDSFVKEKMNDSIKWYAINWEAWDFHRGEDRVDALGSLGKQLDMHAISPEDGEQVLLIASRNAQYRQIIISTSPLQQRFDQWVLKKSIDFGAQNDELKERPAITSDYSKPIKETQKTMAKIWQNAIGVGPIGINDNFFELGGHSLMALQVVQSMSKEFNSDLSVIDLFNYPTIKQLELIISSNDTVTDDLSEFEDRANLARSSLAKFRKKGVKNEC